MSKKQEFVINEDWESGKIYFEKKNYNHKTSPGVPILGWISHINCWFNHLNPNCKGNYMKVKERPEINPEHITLYNENGKLLGWIEKEYKDEIAAALFEYLKVRKRPKRDDDAVSSEINDVSKGIANKEIKSKSKEVAKIEQLSLF